MRGGAGRPEERRGKERILHRTESGTGPGRHARVDPQNLGRLPFPREGGYLFREISRFPSRSTKPNPTAYLLVCRGFFLPCPLSFPFCPLSFPLPYLLGYHTPIEWRRSQSPAPRPDFKSAPHPQGRRRAAPFAPWLPTSRRSRSTSTSPTWRTPRVPGTSTDRVSLCGSLSLVGLGLDALCCVLVLVSTKIRRSILQFRSVGSDLWAALFLGVWRETTTKQLRIPRLTFR